MPDDPLAEITKRIEEQTREIRRLQGTVIWSVFFGTGAILLALFRPQLLVYLLIGLAVLAVVAGMIGWCFSISSSRIRGKPLGYLSFVLFVVAVVIAFAAAFWIHF